jgi:hypothetical protein
MNGFFQKVLPKLFMQGIGSRQVHGTTQDIAQLPAQPDELEQSNMSIGFVFHQDVDIAAFFTLPASNRSKDICRRGVRAGIVDYLVLGSV